jgi:hypothetical protein
MDKQPFKVLLKECWPTDKEYMDAYLRIMKKLLKSRKDIDLKL